MHVNEASIWIMDNHWATELEIDSEMWIHLPNKVLVTYGSESITPGVYPTEKFVSLVKMMKL